MEDYYKDHPDGPLPQLVVDSNVSFVRRKDHVFVLMQGTRSPNGAPAEEAQRMVLLAELTGGEPGVLFDWELMVNYEPLSWSEFIRSKPQQPSPFRVRVRQGDYYNQPFMDDRKFVSFEMTPLHREDKVYGFVPRDSPLAAEIEAKLAKEL